MSNRHPAVPNNASDARPAENASHLQEGHTAWGESTLPLPLDASQSHLNWDTTGDLTHEVNGVIDGPPFRETKGQINTETSSLDAPLPLLPRIALSELCDLVRSTVTNYAHLCLAVRHGCDVHLLLEFTNVPQNTAETTRVLLEKLVFQQYPHVKTTVHTVELEGAFTQPQRASLRACKIQDLLLSKLSLSEGRFDTIFPLGIIDDKEPTPPTRQLLKEAFPSFQFRTHTRSARLYEHVTPPKLPELARRVALKFWGVNQLNFRHYCNTNALEIDLDALNIVAHREEPGTSQLLCERYKNKLNVTLSELGLRTSVRPSSHFPEISSFLDFHLKKIATAHQIAIQGPRVQIAVMVDPSKKNAAIAQVTPIKKLFSEFSELPIDNYFVANSCEISEILFRALPFEWGFNGLVRSKDGRKALVKSRHNYDVIEDVELLELLTSEFPEGVFFNSTHQTQVSSSDPLYSEIFQSLPANCDLRGILQSEVTGDLTLLIKESVPPSVLESISQKVAASVEAVQLPKMNSPSDLRPVLSWLSSQTGRIEPVRPAQMVSTRFEGHGGCRMVGGSCLSLSVGGVNLLLDCGSWLNQKREISIPTELLQNLHFGIVSHHHTDHVGGLLRAMQLGLNSPLLMTRATAIAMYPMLREQAQRQRIPQSAIEKLYRKLVRTVPYGTPIKLSDSLKVTFLDAGHIVGSALTLLECSDGSKQFSVLYTGDYRSESTRLHDGAATVPPVDMIITEGTYGTKLQPDRALEEERLKQKIRTTLLQGGTIVVPLLSSGRAQEVLSILSDETAWLREQQIPIHLRGGIENSNEIYRYLVNDDPNNFTSRVTDRNNWLTLAKLVNASRPCHSTKGSIRKDLASSQQKGRILFASGGMVQGRSEELVRQYCHDPKNLLVFTCFQVPGTLGRRILDYHRGESRMLPEIANFQMDVYYSQLSAHSSGPASVDYVSKALKPGGTVLLVHGELSALNEYAEALRATGIPKHVIVPGIGEQFEFPLSYT